MSTNNLDDKRKFVNEFIRSIAVHSVAEEIVMYPAYRSKLDHGKETAAHSRDEHQQVKIELAHLDRVKTSHGPDVDGLAAKVMNLLEKHMQEEEQVLLPALVESCQETEVKRMANYYVDTKGRVPTHPHPWAPDSPPLETIVGMLQAPLDKAFDRLKRDFPDEEAKKKAKM